MLEIIISIFAILLIAKAIGLAVKITWGTFKIIAAVMIAIAIPAFIVCLIFAGGFILLIPIALISLAVGLLKCCC